MTDSDFDVTEVGELNRLKQQSTQRGARLQIIRKWMAQNIGGLDLWDEFLFDHPEAADWFEDNGVPK